jgi:hypothetical protein
LKRAAVQAQHALFVSKPVIINLIKLTYLLVLGIMKNKFEF